MLQKWKLIISNWINCYFNENNQDERIVTIESLLIIISHLRENLNLDESKSSILEAHTVEEFVLEKYPEFKFENGTVQATNEDEIYLAASLLLFFVCVNSKDVDMKSAMCSKLSGDDQEVILKFSKGLLGCSPITCRDVKAAITEACGLEIATLDTGHVKVAETPPALRSLHGEVRRLQAALDAERFDRNYLQEELARTNARLEKLLKDKEQYKLDIVNLKAKISVCCGQDQDPRGAEAEAESFAKLTRQLNETEERLIQTQEMLDDAVYERDTYKVKMDELKQDRDKWLSFSQQESARVSQLTEELDTERRHMQSLKELVTELRQHNRLNRFDSSQLECDDPDSSIQSLQHNSSVCSEACANVVEVQLGEERAKVDALKQQLQRLQDEMNELTQKTECDKQIFEKVMSEREDDIFNLKHRINEEIEEKNNLKSHYNDEISKLNNEINELEQKIKDNNDNARLTIQQKMQEIQTLQEEKLSLLQSLSNETSKLENIITELKKDIESEKLARLNMRDSYENQMMKLNEKVLNRNNELVELQNNIFEKGEMIESLQLDLRKEKETTNKYHNNMQLLDEQKQEVETKLQNKTEEMNTMQQTLEQNIATVLNEIDHFKTSVASLKDHCRQLEESKMQLEAEINNRSSEFEELYKETENLKNTFSEEIEKLKFDLDERNAIISTLQTHLHDEIHFKIGLQEELQKLQSAKVILSEELNKLNVELSKLRTDLTEKEKTVEAMELYLQEEKNKNEKINADNDKLNEDLTKMTIDITEKNNSIALLNNELDTMKQSYENELSDKTETIEVLNRKLANITAKKDTLQNKLDLLIGEKTKFEHDSAAKCKQISQLQAECERMTKIVDENKKAIRSLDQNMTKEKQKYASLEKSFDTEMSKMMGKLNETEKTIKELSSNSRKAIKNKDHQIHTLNNEIESLKRSLDIDKENITLLHNEREALSQKLNEEISYKNKIEKEYQNQCTQLEDVTAQLNGEIASKNAEIITLKMELDLSMKTIEGKCKELSKRTEAFNTALDKKAREMHLIQQKNQSLTNDLNDVKLQLEVKVHSLKEKLIDNEILTDKLKRTYECQIENLNIMISKVSNYLKDKTVELESARKEKERLLQTIEDNMKAIKSLEEEVKCEKQNQEKLINDFESERQVLKNMVTVTEAVMEDQKVTLNNIITDHVKANEILLEETRTIKELVENERKNFEVKLQEKDTELESVLKEMAEVRVEKGKVEKEIKVHNELVENERRNLEIKLQEKDSELESVFEEIAELKHEKDKIEKEVKALKDTLEEEIETIKEELKDKIAESEKLKNEKNYLATALQKYKEDIISLEKQNSDLKVKEDAVEIKLQCEIDTLIKTLQERTEKNNILECTLKEKTENIKEMEEKAMLLNEQINILEQDNHLLEQNKKAVVTENEQYITKIAYLDSNIKEIEKTNKLLREQLNILEQDKNVLEKEKNVLLTENKQFLANISYLNSNVVKHSDEIGNLKKENLDLINTNEENKRVIVNLEQRLKEAQEKDTKLREDYVNEKLNLVNKCAILQEFHDKAEKELEERKKEITSLQKELKSAQDLVELREEESRAKDAIVSKISKEKDALINTISKELEEEKATIEKLQKEIKEKSIAICELKQNLEGINNEREALNILRKENEELIKAVGQKETLIINLEQQLKENNEGGKKLHDDIVNEKLNLVTKCAILKEYHDKAEKELEERQKEIKCLRRELKSGQHLVVLCEEESRAKDVIVSKISKEKDIVISTICKELEEEKITTEKLRKEIKEKTAVICELKQNLEGINNEREALNILRKENEELIKAVGQRETFAVQVQERTSSHKHSGQAEKELRDLHHQVDNTSSDITHSSVESLKTISDLEKIIHDKNRSITTLQSDVTYLKTLMAESETKLLDVTKELEISKENCHQLSSQLKKIVHQKNEEIAELKKQVNKMSVTENRATQIIKVSAKYQAIILKRIAEIKTNTVLKELTNFGNSNTYDNEVKRSLNAGSITMEDLENFLENTDRHLKKCSEKQLALQKERDRLTEVNRINESEVINLKKFLTELSVSFQTFSSVKDLYAQKLSRVTSVQRTVRREILNLDGHISDTRMGKLERSYAAGMQDLAECALNLERWVERCIGRTISSEKLKQAFMSDLERTSLATTSYQNTGLEVQLEELEKSFQKLLEEVACAQRGEGARDVQAATVMEVRAEYEDKLNRMKAKMKQLYTEQIAVFKEKQKEEIALLERELCHARDKLAASSRAYEEHIRGLTTELWSVGEKFLMKKDEAEWLRRKQRSGSLMSLQHVHSSGLVSTQEETSRPSDTYSLRSLPINNNGTRREGRGLHMSDEEGEVFDNRWLKELSATPRRDSAAPGQRLSELRWRNSLCPPHLKSSYPAETQFTQAVDEEDIKYIGAAGAPGTKQQRKEVGITAYKKPGPPTPSKQAGRLSATDSELRESLRVEGEPQPQRKTSTPSRIRSLFRSSRNDTTEGTPRTKRLSNIFRKK